MEKIGQLVMAGFDGLTVNDPIKKLILDDGVGGVILFKRNIESIDQVSHLTGTLKELSKQCNPNFPLLIAIDQEGGRVSRLPSPPFRTYPSYRELGFDHSEKAVYDNTVLIAEDLKKIGVNMNMAPVLDVDTHPDNPIIGDRSFSKDPFLVGKLGNIVIQAFQEKGIIPVGKHYPGHGDTSVDSHLELPVVDKHLNQLENLELIPFKMGINIGLPSIMVAHVLYTGIDSKYPATISKYILTSLLREKIGFNGVIMSDDLEMKGILEWGSMKEIVTKSVDAGIDIFLCCKSLAYQKEILTTIRNLYEKKSELRKKIIRSIDKVIQLKKGWGFN